MTQELLHDAQVRTAFEKMSSRGVTQTVRAHVRGAGDRGQYVVNGSARLTRIDTSPPPTQQQRRAGVICRQSRPTVGHPDVERRICRGAVGRRPLLVALAQHTQNSPVVVDVIHVETAQFADPDTRRIQKFDYQTIPECNGVELTRAFFCPVQRLRGLVLSQNGRQCAPGRRARQPQRRISSDTSGPGQPGGERARRRRSPRHRCTCGSIASLLRQPRAKHAEIEFVQDADFRRNPARGRYEVNEQRLRVLDVRTHRVRRTSAPQREVLLVLLEVHSQRGR